MGRDARRESVREELVAADNVVVQQHDDFCYRKREGRKRAGREGYNRLEERIGMVHRFCMRRRKSQFSPRIYRSPYHWHHVGASKILDCHFGRGVRRGVRPRERTRSLRRPSHPRPWTTSPSSSQNIHDSPRQSTTRNQGTGDSSRTRYSLKNMPRSPPSTSPLPNHTGMLSLPQHVFKYMRHGHRRSRRQSHDSRTSPGAAAFERMASWW